MVHEAVSYSAWETSKVTWPSGKPNVTKRPSESVINGEVSSPATATTAPATGATVAGLGSNA